MHNQIYIDTDYSPNNNCYKPCKNIYSSFQQWVEILDIIITPIKQHISSKKWPNKKIPTPLNKLVNNVVDTQKIFQFQYYMCMCSR